MARTARSKDRSRAGWPAIEAGIAERLGLEPSTARVAGTLALAAVALYFSALGYPLVFGDFAFLSAARLGAYARALPVIGGNWLADASFGWSAALFGVQWPWHRAVNVGLHICAVVAAFALFRRILTGAVAEGRTPVAGGWIAFLAAALFALHPAAVYGVAYLSSRYALLLSVFTLIALWSTARSMQAGGRLAWIAGPLATGAALGCSANALGIPFGMAFLALALSAAGAAERRRAWVGVAVAGLVAIAYAIAWAVAGAAGAELGALGYVNSLAATCTRILRYLAFWLVPLTPYMAIDMPEPSIAITTAWPGWLGIVGTLAVAASIAAVLVRSRNSVLRAAAIGLGCAAALHVAELAWPRLAVPFSLTRSYAWMPPVLLATACLVASLPRRAAWAAACVALLVWLTLAAATLQTFSTHVALWDDAVRGAERGGTRPEDARIYLNRATLHRHEGHSLAALADYDKALQLQPDMARALRGRAQVYVDEKRYGEALRDLDRLLELEPGHAITHADRGLALMQAGRFNEAGPAFDRAIERGVREPRVFLNRALARLQLGGLGAAPVALVDIERAIALDPSYALAYFNRAMVFEQAANAGIRLRDALSPELMRAVAAQNLERACKLGHAGACERHRASSEALLPNEGPLRVTPESLQRQGLPGR